MVKVWVQVVCLRVTVVHIFSSFFLSFFSRFWFLGRGEQGSNNPRCGEVGERRWRGTGSNNPGRFVGGGG